MIVNEFIDFLAKCPTQFHFCAYARSELIKYGFDELNEDQELKEMPKKGFFIRDEREIIAWNDSGHERAIIAGAHCDSPCLILQQNFDEAIGGYRRCKCNTYGEGQWFSWFDRTLKLAGRILIKTSEEDKDTIKSLLFDSEIGIAAIPCIAPHLDSSFSYRPLINPISNFIPIYGTESQTPPLLDYIASKLNIDSNNIVSYDLHFIDSDPPYEILEKDKLIIHSQKLDGLQNTYAVLKSFINSTPDDGTISMISIFDNEIVGNKNRASSSSDIIGTTLQRILHFNSSDLRTFKANSFFVNCKSFGAQNPNIKENEAFCDVCIGNGICMQRSSVIKPVPHPKDDFPIQEAIRRIIIESTAEKLDDHQISDLAPPRPTFVNGRRGKNIKPSNPEMKYTIRYETVKEATENDDFDADEFAFTRIPDYTVLENFYDDDYPSITKKIHAINKQYQLQRQRNTNKNENENENENQQESSVENESKNQKNESKNEQKQENPNENENENKNKNKRKNIVRNEKGSFPSQDIPANPFPTNGENDLLGSLNENETGILSIDIGVPIIGMNSIRELGSFNDIKFEFDILHELFTNFSKYTFPF